MSTHMSQSTCELCGFETVELCGTEWIDGYEFEETYCMSLFCGFYNRIHENFTNPELSLEESGNHCKEDVCELREGFHLRYGKR